MGYRNQFKNEEEEPITIQFKDRSGLKLLIIKLKNRLINN